MSEDANDLVVPGIKRKSDASLVRQDGGAKRFALGNLTNDLTEAASSNANNSGMQKGAITKSKVTDVLKQPMKTLMQHIRGNITRASSQVNDSKFQSKPMKIYGMPRIMTRAARRKLQNEELSIKQTQPLNQSTIVEENVPEGAAIPAHQANVELLGEFSGRLASLRQAVRNRQALAATQSVDGGQLVEERETGKNAVQNERDPLGKQQEVTRSSGEFETSDDSLYVTAMENLNVSVPSQTERKSPPPNQHEPIVKIILISDSDSDEEDEEDPSDNGGFVRMLKRGSIPVAVIEARAWTAHLLGPRKMPPATIEDFDSCYWRDVSQMSEYAQDIFDYMKDREASYAVPDYIEQQPHVTKMMRALLVDWFIEIQETFELNHETLYLAVKIVDTYLSRVVITRDKMQLVGIAAMLMAAKYDERMHPTVNDFIYLCDGAYERGQLLAMERSVFRTIDYDLGFTLSYTMLRRYARVSRVPMQLLTLARYILEAGLMTYDTVTLSDSKLACAALFIAQRMMHQPGWNETLEYHSGYKVEEFANIIRLLNENMVRRRCVLNSVQKKYRHELYFSVATVSPIICMTTMFGMDPDPSNGDDARTETTPELIPILN